MISQKLQEFEEEVKATGDIITQVSCYSSLNEVRAFYFTAKLACDFASQTEPVTL